MPPTDPRPMPPTDPRVESAWWRFKELEARCVIAPLQRAASYESMEPLVKLTKACTRRGAYAAYGAVVLGACPRKRYAELAVAFVVSRRVNEALKQWASQARPYVEFPGTVAYFKKRKLSHSFPSQSVQTLCVAWCAFHNDEDSWSGSVRRFGSYYVALLICLVAVVRVYRGLHYPHDVLCSLAIARALVAAVARMLAKIASEKHLAALLVGCFSTEKLAGSAADD
mmetsp:Transcript_10831/g.32579  ORF Transcript_10831/g.32579 Transcript_10831/m.32579 type:complete len:226 (-) Transcript_10831:370-1047(-)|eukprot:CAMPEP_0198657726 /NCGR_PEP_ID=MMETSP1467-20131203/19025_1 /TAXON_ID=1462469 /ORGANISM="unid. sp., Strain CCMP2135" /LENGTH=225 /DNA_ID=CAMNT_0044393945 /DNA_START=215 /DNA_END=892 /DNA_ORIENTATION=-